MFHSNLIFWFSSSTNFLNKPKSIILISKLFQTKNIFSGFKSLWKIPALCKASTTFKIFSKIYLYTSSVKPALLLSINKFPFEPYYSMIYIFFEILSFSDKSTTEDS